ncbi:MAG: trypsin-like peptidase domain-containing protein [Chloroflexi bacterium]|nr:trypsin-like peptidase domain-containing protein [Chloroflexota bacterium]MCI0782512.1 trypsin-like peptidase domain-containing protein [Chloroflexota bacterium]
MNTLSLALVLLVLGFTGLACAARSPIPTPMLAPTTTPVPTVDIEATVKALIAAALPSPVPTPNIDATVEARVQAIMRAIPTPTPAPTPPATATQKPVSPTPTPDPLPIAGPAPVPNRVGVEQVEDTVKFDPYHVIQQSVVKIISNTRQGTSQGSGVVIGHGDHVITNAHVVEGAIGNIRVSFHPESGPSVATNGQVVFSSENIDLALIKVESPLGEPIEVSRSLPSLGDTLILGGFPGIGGETLTATRGTVAGFDFNGAVIKFDGQIGHGSSGGAAVNEDGKLVGIATASSGEPSGGNLGLLLSITVVGHTLVRALLEDSQDDTQGNGSRYLLQIVGVPAVATVPDGWDIVANFGYFDMRAPGTGSDVLSKDYHVVGIFTPDLATDESPEDILDRIVAESEGGFEIVPDSQIEPPDGFSQCTLLYSDKRFEMSSFKARGSVIGNGWVTVAGLHTRFCVGLTATKTVIGYVESPSRESSKEDGQWLSSTMTILSN